MSWKNKPDTFMLNMLETADRHVQKIVGDTLQQVVIRSPVMDGEFRASHKVTTNSPELNYKRELDTAGNTTLAEGLKVASTAKLGDLVYVQTNSPYGDKLENGHSKQAPLGVYSLAFRYVSEKYR